MPVKYPKYIAEQLKRKLVRDVIKCVEDIYDGIDLRSFVEDAYNYANNTGQKYDTIFLEKEHYGYDGGYELYLVGSRLENDKEYAHRSENILKAYKKKLEKRKTDTYKKEQVELKEYERLRKKYEK